MLRVEPSAPSAPSLGWCGMEKGRQPTQHHSPHRRPGTPCGDGSSVRMEGGGMGAQRCKGRLQGMQGVGAEERWGICSTEKGWKGRRRGMQGMQTAWNCMGWMQGMDGKDAGKHGAQRAGARGRRRGWLQGMQSTEGHRGGRKGGGNASPSITLPLLAAQPGDTEGFAAAPLGPWGGGGGGGAQSSEQPPPEHPPARG